MANKKQLAAPEMRLGRSELQESCKSLRYVSGVPIISGVLEESAQEQELDCIVCLISAADYDTVYHHRQSPESALQYRQKVPGRNTSGSFWMCEGRDCEV